MYFKEISIKNYRGIKELKIGDFNKINFLLGDNQAGKTSLLESIFILTAPTDPERLITVTNFRDILIDTFDDFNFLFYDRNFDNNIEFKTKRENNTIDTLNINKIRLNAPFTLKNSNVILNVDNLIEYDYEFHNVGSPKNGVKTQLILQNNTNHNFNINLNQIININQLNFIYNGDRKINLFKSEYKLLNNFRDNNFYFKLEIIQQNKELPIIINYMNQIGFAINDIRLGEKNKIYIDFKNLKSLIPLNNAGDGLIKILSIISSMYINKNGIVLIDEIENGLHHSKMEKMLQIIIKAAIDFKVQVFITSHNVELLDKLVIGSNDSFKEFIAGYRMNKNDEKNFAFKMDYDEIKYSLDNDIEIRN